MGKKYRRETFGTIGEKIQRKLLFSGQNSRILPFWSEVLGWHSALCWVKPRHFGTLHQWCVKFLSTIFYLFWGRKYRIKMFGHRADKMYKKSWKETFSTIRAKFRRKILSPGQNFKILPFQSEVPGCTLHSAECHAGTSELGTSSENQTSICSRVYMILMRDTRWQPDVTRDPLTRTSWTAKKVRANEARHECPRLHESIRGEASVSIYILALALSRVLSARVYSWYYN